jgi:hypothetical protein
LPGQHRPAVDDGFLRPENRKLLTRAASLDDLVRLAAPIRPQTAPPAARACAPAAPMEKVNPTLLG